MSNTVDPMAVATDGFVAEGVTDSAGQLGGVPAAPQLIDLTPAVEGEELVPAIITPGKEC